MPRRCEHGFLTGEKLCTVATCPEWDGRLDYDPTCTPEAKEKRRRDRNAQARARYARQSWRRGVTNEGVPFRPKKAEHRARFMSEPLVGE